MPAIVFGDKFLVGDQPIIDNFENEIEAAETRMNFPIRKKLGIQRKIRQSGESRIISRSQTASGNKKNYFPVIIIALVVVGGERWFM